MVFTSEHYFLSHLGSVKPRRLFSVLSFHTLQMLALFSYFQMWTSVRSVCVSPLFHS